jgi:hypothetical protein
MTGKYLSDDEAIIVAEKATEIVKAADGGFVKEQTVISKIYETMPKFQGRPLWKAFSLAIDKNLLKYTNYKGYYYDKVVAPFASSISLYDLPKKDDGKEHHYYPFVANWFLKSGNCRAQFRKGREWGIPDVSVVRGSSSAELDELELVTVEVKRGGATVSDLSQAYRYSKLAHRCYLASDSESDLVELREHAERMGVGLMVINSRDPNDIKELLGPPRSEPSTISLHEHLANAFDLVTCCLCGVWFERIYANKKENIQGTTCIVRKRATGGPDVWRYACPECEEVFKLAKGVRPLRW